MLRRILCALGLHHWEIVLYSQKHINLLHLHPMAGCLAHCIHCKAVWDDLPEGWEAHPENYPRSRPSLLP